MANNVYFQLTTFHNIHEDGTPTGEKTLGYRIYDDYECVYDNTFPDMESMKKAGITPEKIINFIAATHPQFYETICEKGLHFNNRYIAPPDDI